MHYYYLECGCFDVLNLLKYHVDAAVAAGTKQL